MATGGKEDSEDASYLSVRGEIASQTREKKSVGSIANKETTELNAIKTMNKNLNEKIKTLKQEINDQKAEFEAEKMNMIRSHRREIDNFKKIHEKTLDRFYTKSRENEKHIEEIKRLKAVIESLEKTEEELREKVKKAKYDGEHRKEYENQMREMSASKDEIRKLKEQIIKLENIVAEKEEETSKAVEHNAHLSKELGDLGKKHEDDMAAMKNDLIDKIDEKGEDTKKMFQSLEQLILRTQGQNRDTVMSQQFEQNKTPLPPITSRSPPNTNPLSGTKPTWKPF